MGDDEEELQDDYRFKKQCVGTMAKQNHGGERAEVIHLHVLPRGARPMPFAPLDYAEVPNSRQLCCPGYNRCLEFVASIKWQGFSCRRCPLSDEEKWINYEDERQNEGSAAAVIRLSRG